ncbi:MAG: hypothetical protein AB8G15_09805 [Saprospiraceae bacterium]
MEKIISFLREAEKDKTYQESFKAVSKEVLEWMSEWMSPAAQKKLQRKKDNTFEQQKTCRLLLTEHFKKPIGFKDACWIIRSWGGIKSFIGPGSKGGRDKNKNKNKLENFIAKLDTDELSLTKDEFSTISSLSKVSFFYDFNRYFIYDSRVIYVLNWILFKTQSEVSLYFPMPSGRNKNITQYPVEALIKFSFLGKGIKAKDLDAHYYTGDIAYRKYNELLKALANELYGDQAQAPFLIEMLLFGMADKFVLNDLERSVNISLNS